VLNDLKEKVTFTPVFIILTGSLASLNFDEFSDIDLHIGIDFSTFPKEEIVIIKTMLVYYARVFNNQNYTLKGRKIEVYFQDSNEVHQANGIYNLQQDFWIKTPDQTLAHFNSRVKEAAGKYLSEVSVLVFEWAEVPRNREAIKQFLDKVNAYMKQVVEMRKQSLLHDGMSGFGNQVFRELRRNGVLPKLSGLRTEATEAYYDVYESIGGKMSKAKKLTEYLSAAYHHNIIEKRQVDKDGKPIRPVEEYSLKHKKRGYYHMGGGWQGYATTYRPEEAEIFKGSMLIDSAYDWTMDWEAIIEK